MPSYPRSEIFSDYKNKLYKLDNIDGIKVFRSWLIVAKSSNIVYRLFNYFSFVLTSFVLGLKIINKDTNLILCESPPLFLGITALFLKKIKKTKLLFNVSDLWPKTAAELGIIKNKYLIRVTTLLEEYIYKNSDLISGQTMGIIKNIDDRGFVKPLFWYKNSYNFNTLVSQPVINWRNDNNFNKHDFLILYAGILGHAQGLETCLRAAKSLKANKNIHFIFLGSGPEEKKLISLKQSAKLENVTFFGHVEKSILLSIITEIDVGLVPLKNLPIFEGAIPSKIFDVLAQKKPILLGVKGEAKQIFIDEANSGIYFEPENEIDLAAKVSLMYDNRENNLVLGQNGYNFIKDQFNQEYILSNYLTFINQNIR